MSEKDAKLLAFCRAQGVEGVWMRRRSNIAWATGGADVACATSTGRAPSTFLWTPTRKVLFTDVIEAPRLEAEEPALAGVEIRARPWWEPEEVPEGGFATDWPDDPLYPLRASLTEEECRRARTLGAECAEAMATLLLALRPGTSERAFAGELAAALLSRGIRAPVLLMAADDRIARFRHPMPTARRIERTFMAVLCAERQGLIVCLTRLVSFGEPSADLRRRHAAVVAVDLALHRASAPGTRFCDALARGIEAYASAGFADEWKKHHQGGPMGYECRDFKATPKETRTIQPRQLLGWNPSITGTKSEDTILAGGEVLTAMPDWPLLGTRPDLLVRRA